MHRVAVQADSLVEQLVAETRLPILRRERAATLVGRSGVEAVDQESGQIRDRLWLEDDRVGAGLDWFRVSRLQGLLDGLRGNLLRVEDGEIEMVGRVVAGSGSVRAASRDAEPGFARSEVAAVAVCGGGGGGRRPRGVKAGADYLGAAARGQDLLQRRRASLEVDVRRRRRESRGFGICQRSERRDVFAMDRRRGRCP